jgi:hypothetical protein
MAPGDTTVGLTLASSGRPYWAFVDASRRRARLAVALVPFDGEDVEVGEASAQSLDAGING